MWYLQTRLIETDGSLTFIESFYEPVLVLTQFIQASVRLRMFFKVELLLWLQQLVSQTQADTRAECNSELQLEAAASAGLLLETSSCSCVSLHSLSHHYFDEIKPKNI